MDSGLKCLVAVARYHGVDLSVDRLKHDFALAENDSIDRLLPSIARKSGFRAKTLKLKSDASRRATAITLIIGFHYLLLRSALCHSASPATLLRTRI